jgi:flagellar protein FlaG
MVINTIATNTDTASRSSGTSSASSAVAPAGQLGQTRQNLPVAGGTGSPPAQGNSPAREGSLEQAVTALTSHIQTLQRDLQFSIDDGSGETIVKVIDSSTEEVIRQIPSEEVLALAEHLDEASGVLLKREA